MENENPSCTVALLDCGNIGVFLLAHCAYKVAISIGAMSLKMQPFTKFYLKSKLLSDKSACAFMRGNRVVPHRIPAVFEGILCVKCTYFNKNISFL